MIMSSKLVIVTGASRGFGRATAISLAKSLVAPTHFVLSGKDVVELTNTATLIDENRSPELKAKIKIVSADLANTLDLPNVASDLFDIDSQDSFNELIFINNAGSLGPLGHIGAEVQTIQNLAEAVNINITASCFLTSELTRR
jgi:short-subunit dehydrogenase